MEELAEGSGAPARAKGPRRSKAEKKAVVEIPAIVDDKTPFVPPAALVKRCAPLPCTPAFPGQLRTSHVAGAAELLSRSPILWTLLPMPVLGGRHIMHACIWIGFESSREAACGNPLAELDVPLALSVLIRESEDFGTSCPSQHAKVKKLHLMPSSSGVDY